GGEVASFAPAEIDRLLDVNLRAPIVLAREVLPAMTDRGRGHLVFVSSLAAAFPTPGLTLYNASKSALDSFALSVRGEVQPRGIGVTLVHLGPIRDAGMWAQAGLTLRGLRTNSPAEVGAAVVGAIEHNRSEVTVGPLALRAGARLARVAPMAFARV